MSEITINKEQRLFVFKESHGYTCQGFDVVYKQCLEMARRIKQFSLLPQGTELAPILESEIGTMAQYEQYKNILKIIGDRKLGTWFHFDTPTKVRQIINQYIKGDGRLRLFYGDTKTGRCWMEENDVVGLIGRSGGTMQIPLLIAKDEHGGPGILDNCIVRIIDADSREELYRHKLYHLPEMEIRQVDEKLFAIGYTHGVWAKNKEGNFENHANLRSFGKAAQFVAFMSGECCEQPQ